VCVVLNQEKIDFQIFVIHLNNKTLQTLFLKTLATILIFSSSSKFGVLNYFSLPMEKMSAFMDKFTAQTAILSANFLVPAQTIPYNAQFAQFIFLSVAFTKIY
jgi:hypothetical protein